MDGNPGMPGVSICNTSFKKTTIIAIGIEIPRNTNEAVAAKGHENGTIHKPIIKTTNIKSIQQNNIAQAKAILEELGNIILKAKNELELANSGVDFYNRLYAEIEAAEHPHDIIWTFQEFDSTTPVEEK